MGNNKKSPKGAQMMVGTVARMMMTAMAMSAISSAPTRAESLQHSPVAREYFDRNCLNDFDLHAQDKIVDLRGLVSWQALQYSLDFSSFTVESCEIEDENMLYPGGSQTSSKCSFETKWSIEELHNEMALPTQKQQRFNDKMDAIQKARLLCQELDTPEPPDISELDELALPSSHALVGRSSCVRVWDSGATSGMTRPDSTDGARTSQLGFTQARRFEKHD